MVENLSDSLTASLLQPHFAIPGTQEHEWALAWKQLAALRSTIVSTVEVDKALNEQKLLDAQQQSVIQQLAVVKGAALLSAELDTMAHKLASTGSNTAAFRKRHYSRLANKVAEAVADSKEQHAAALQAQSAHAGDAVAQLAKLKMRMSGHTPARSGKAARGS